MDKPLGIITMKISRKSNYQLMPTEIIKRRRSLDKDILAVYRHEMNIAKAEIEEKERIDKEIEENKERNSV